MSDPITPTSAESRASMRVQTWTESLTSIDVELLDRLAAGEPPKVILSDLQISNGSLSRKLDAWKETLNVRNQAQIIATWLQTRDLVREDSASASDSSAPTVMQHFHALKDKPIVGSRPVSLSSTERKISPSLLLCPVLTRTALAVSLREVADSARTLVAQHATFLTLVPALVNSKTELQVPSLDETMLGEWICQNELAWLPIALTLRWSGLLPHIPRLEAELTYESDWGLAFRKKFAINSRDDLEAKDYLFWEGHRDAIIQSRQPNLTDEICNQDLAMGPLTGVLAALFWNPEGGSKITAAKYVCDKRSEALRTKSIALDRFWVFLVMAANGLPTADYLAH